MDMNSIIIAAVVIAAVGIIVGVGLGLFGAKFKVEVDEKEAAVREELPGNNCGGCGYPGCDGLAKAIAEGKAPVNACPVGGAPVGEKIAAIMGVEAGSSEKKVKVPATRQKYSTSTMVSRTVRRHPLYRVAVQRHVLTAVPASVLV